MGKKGSVKTTTKVTTTMVQRQAPNAGQAQAQSATSTTLSTMNDVEELLKWLEGQLSKKDESSRVLKRLLQAYKLISVRNKVDSKREELLQQDISDLQRRNAETSEEVRRLQELYRAAELKADKLGNLSKILTDRVKSIECKANEDVKAEKEDRLRLSYEFSARIKDISVKLDFLGQRREQIVTENTRLKELLRACFDEFSNDPEMRVTTEAVDEQMEHQTEGKEEGGKEEEEGKSEAGEKSSALTVIEITANDTEQERERKRKREREREEEERRKKEAYLFEFEGDVSKILQLREQEDILKQQSTKFMDVFDSFQQRLTESNQLFKLKQGRVEEITKEIKAIEKTNSDTSARIGDCAQSTKLIMEVIVKLRQQKEKYKKLIGKQKELIDVFQTDIANMEAKLK